MGKYFQALDAGLTSLAALAGGANMLPYYTAADVFSQTSFTAVGRSLVGQSTAAAALSYLAGAPLASPTFTGTPTAPTAAAGTNTTQIATTAFVQAVAALLAPLASPALTGTPTVPTPAVGTVSTQAINAAFVTQSSVVAGAIGRLVKSQLITSSASFTPPPAIARTRRYLVAGGGGSGGTPATASTTSSCGQAGFYGQYIEVILSLIHI